ncbi:MAG: glycoside hydrolase family 3 N-terminal domain-containing protein [Gemmatimonadaceae bacterium]
MTGSLAALLVPELRWEPGQGFAGHRAAIDAALEIGVGGFVVCGGPVAEVAELTAVLHASSRIPLLIGAEAEQGAGECFAGATGLPPLGALAALRDDDVVRRAARLTARELRALGVTWAIAPSADLDLGLANPMLGARSFGAEPQRVAEWTVAWTDACQAEGVLACAKHFPGIGRATADPHRGAVSVDEGGAQLWSADLVPFRAAVDAGVATLLVAQVSYPRLDASGALATRSPLLLRELLRGELQYEGLLVSDRPSQPGALVGDDEGAATLEAVVAGCDLVLAPMDLAGALAAFDRGLDEGRLVPSRLEDSLRRRTFWAEWGRPQGGREATLEDVLWARQVADTVVHPVRGVIPNIGPVVDVIPVDDDADAAGPSGADRFGAFFAALRAVGMTPERVEGPTDAGRGAVVVAVRGAPASGRGRAGYREATRHRVARAVADARAARRSIAVVVFGPPRLADELPEASNVICAWSAARAMQEAAARRLA